MKYALTIFALTLVGADGPAEQKPLPLPRIAPPRTQAEPVEVWRLTLSDAIKIGLANSEVVRVISLGTEGILVGGFESASGKTIGTLTKRGEIAPLVICPI